VTPLTHALDAVRQLAQRAEWLDASLLPGTARPYRPPHLTPEAREAADALARAERLERSDVAPGDAPDPIWSEGVELRTDLLALADAMAEQVAQTAGVDRMPDASWDSDPVPYLRHVERWLEQAAEADGKLTEHVERKCRQYVERIDAILGQHVHGMRLPTVCPWCDKTELRIRIPRAERPAPVRWWIEDGIGPMTSGAYANYELNRHNARALVVCESGTCEPGDGMVGNWYRDLPAWDFLNEGEWLVQCAKVKQEARACKVCGENVRPTGQPGRPAEFCSDDCRLAYRRERRAMTRRQEEAA
jgi:hypothetical protein